MEQTVGGGKRGGAVDRAGLREVRDTKNILLKNMNYQTYEIK